MPDTVIAGRYQLDELLGRGGMSEVYRADDLELERRVALKLLAPDADSARFEREARAVAALAHPNVMQVYDYGEDNGRPYMVLEYVPGGTLEQRLAAAAGKPLPDDESGGIAAGIAAGLAHAHARGVVHRDLKPANVFFDDEGRPKIGDFGIARMAAREGTLTEAGTVLGTAAYISPEQASGAAATPASDVYSFGVILYRMLTGRLPFESDDPLELLLMHRDRPAPPVTELRRNPPALLESAAMAALEKDPADRPRDGGALLAALGAGPATTAVDDDATRVLPAAGPVTAPTAVSPAASPPPAEPPRSRVPLLVAALLVLVLAGGALAYELTRPAASSGTTPTQTLPSISLPRSSSTEPTTTEAPTTQATQATSTEQTTTGQTTTQAPATTRTPPTTTALPLPTTTATLPTTTEVVTTTPGASSLPVP